MQPSTQHTDELRQQILSAAEQRFRQYGYNKTTMAEIATDCTMSAANLYRYFENKLDIGANLACQCLDNEITTLKSIVNEQQLSVTARLRRFVMANLQLTHGQWSDTPRINEMVMAICNERMDIVDQHFHKKHALMVDLLTQGHMQDVFDIADSETTADAVLTACTLFNVPMLMPLYSLDVFEDKATKLVDLLLKGLLKRN